MTDVRSSELGYVEGRDVLTEARFAGGDAERLRVLRGTPAAELAFEMASTFRLVLNLRTSRELGVVIPETVGSARTR